MENPGQLFDEISEDTGIIWSTYQLSMTEDSLMRRVTAEFVSGLSTQN